MKVSALAIALLIATASALPFQAALADPGDAEAGRAIAQTWCSNCHVAGSRSTASSGDTAPSFAAVAKMPSTTSLSIHAFLQTSHGQMPDFALSRLQIDDIAAYVLSLKHPTN